MEIKQININELVSPEWNPRQGTEKEYADLKASITKFGLVDPVIVNKRNNHIVGGNFRTRVARDMGFTEMPCVYVDLDEEAEKELNIRLNANHGSFDKDLLASFDLEELKDWGVNLNELDINIDKIDDLEVKEEKLNQCPQCGFNF